MAGRVSERGPAPERTNARRRRNKKVDNDDDASNEVDTVVIDAPAIDPKYTDINPNWHPAAQMLWEAALDSGQRVFYEPSDWAVLRLTCSTVDQYYRDDIILEKIKLPMEAGSGGGEELVLGRRAMSASELTAVGKLLGSIGFSELDRRRMKIELERGEAPEETTEDETRGARMTLLTGGKHGIAQ